MCGSLVTVRNGKLQIVHLTVKQYIESASGPEAARPLTETDSANLQLTLACLGFIKRECAEPIAELSPRRPIENKENKPDLSVLRSKKPFLGYACCAWLIHLLECKHIDALEVSTALYQTFHSPSTFGWIESCMMMLPGCVPLLLIGLEDVRYWISDLHSDGTSAEALSFSFVSSWCATIEQVLREYGPAVEWRSSEIYYLDLSSAFSSHTLTGLYKKHRGLARRERCTRFPTDKFSLRAWNKVPPERQLRKSSYHLLGIFLFEPSHDIFIWNYHDLGRGQCVLSAQSASSGRQLPPIHDSRIVSTHGSCQIKSYAMSKDSRYLAIVYQRIFSLALVISIWEIEVTLDFTRRTQGSPWARIIHISTYDNRARRFDPCIAFDQDGVCFTPNGLFYTASNCFVPIDFLQCLQVKYGQLALNTNLASYSENGKFLFFFSETTMTKYSTPSLDVEFRLSTLD